MRRHNFCCILEQTPHSGQIGLLRLGTLKGYHTIRLIQFTGSFFKSQNVCQTTSIKELNYILVLQNIEKCQQFCIRISLKTTIHLGSDDYLRQSVSAMLFKVKILSIQTLVVSVTNGSEVSILTFLPEVSESVSR